MIMYLSELPFPEYKGMYMSMPPGLPARFYPKDPNDRYETERYVLCLNKNFPKNKEERDRFAKRYKEYYDDLVKRGIYF